jgi:hypothetical protein
MNEEVCVDDIAKLLSQSQECDTTHGTTCQATPSSPVEHAQCRQPCSLSAAGVKRKPAAYPEVCRP